LIDSDFRFEFFKIKVHLDGCLEKTSKNNFPPRTDSSFLSRNDPQLRGHGIKQAEISGGMID